MHGAFVWNELATSDVAGARAFYESMLGWSFEEFALADGPYWVAKVGEAIVGGLGGAETAADPQSTRPGWYAFVEVTAIDDRVERAAALGGTVLKAPHDVPNVGRVAVVRDPTGAVIGLLQQPAARADGPGQQS